MSSTAADVLPALPPIRTTTPPAPEPACSSAASSSTAPAPDAESVAALPPPAEEQQGETGSEAPREAEPTTPTSEGSRLRRPAECPPAPRKPAWAPPPPSTPANKRRSPSSSAAPPPPPARRAFFPVARDLTTVFRALPPKKRIRAG